MAGKQGFLPPCFSKLFNIKQLRSKLLKTQNFLFSYCFVCFDIFSYFLPWNGHKMGTSLSFVLLRIYPGEFKSYIHSYRRLSTGFVNAALID